MFLFLNKIRTLWFNARGQVTHLVHNKGKSMTYVKKDILAMKFTN